MTTRGIAQTVASFVNVRQSSKVPGLQQLAVAFIL
jgi:hypothetical protein